MKMMSKWALAASAIFWISAAVAQDDETRTTTTVHHEDHGPGAYVGVPGVAGFHVGPGAGPRSGCETRHKTVTNEDTGESRSRTETNC